MADRPSEPDDVRSPFFRFAERWAAPAFLVMSVLMVPWTVYLALTLPKGQEVPHYRGAWVGFDIGLLASLGATGWAAAKRSHYFVMLATMTGTLLTVDAWFDVTTSLGRQRVMAAVAAALFVELPLAATCFWLSTHVELLQQIRLRLASQGEP